MKTAKIHSREKQKFYISKSPWALQAQGDLLRLFAWTTLPPFSPLCRRGVEGMFLCLVWDYPCYWDAATQEPSPPSRPAYPGFCACETFYHFSVN